MDNGLKDRMSKLRQQLSTIMGNARLTHIIVIIISIIIIVGIVWYISNKLSLRKRGCNSLRKTYKDFPPISSINDYDNKFKYTLKDYYIKTAYNACSIGDFKNSYVDLCALKQVIRQGYRCLDMAVYSVNNEPVISTSNINSYDVKYTYNSVPFDAVCETIANQGFANAGCPNPNDPILIHLRIMSQNSVIFKKMADIISKRLSDYILGKKYSYEYDGKNIGDVKLTDLQQRVIFMVDKSNPMYEGTDLDEYVNIASNSIFMQALRYDEMRYAPDMQELIEFNKRKMSIILPNLGVSDDNNSAALPFKYGCQMVAMSIQNKDSNVDFYNDFFNKAGSAFSLKPDNLLYKPITVTMPNNPSKKLSYAKRDISSDFYNFNI
jgi:hypothetical protein